MVFATFNRGWMQMQKQQIFDLFKGQISITAIRRDEEYRIVGKYVEVRFFDDSQYFEIYLLPGASTNRVNKFMERMDKYELFDYKFHDLPSWEAFHVWDKEAMIRTADLNAVLDNLKWFGIRRKRKVDSNWVPPWEKKNAET